MKTKIFTLLVTFLLIVVPAIAQQQDLSINSTYRCSPLETVGIIGLYESKRITNNSIYTIRVQNGKVIFEGDPIYSGSKQKRTEYSSYNSVLFAGENGTFSMQYVAGKLTFSLFFTKHPMVNGLLGQRTDKYLVSGQCYIG